MTAQPHTGQHLLSLHDLVVGYTEPILAPLTLDLDHGQGVALAGQSGRGKTTIMRTVAGLMDPLGGKAVLEGDTPAETGYPAWRRRVVLLHQRPQLHSGTIGENLERPFRFRAAETSFPEDDAKRFLDYLDLGRYGLDTSVDRLSEGERQRVSLARAFLIRPRLFLLDEPTSALHEAAAEAVEDMLLDYVKENRAGFLIAGHDPEQLARLTTNVVELDRLAPAEPPA